MAGLGGFARCSCKCFPFRRSALLFHRARIVLHRLSTGMNKIIPKCFEALEAGAGWRCNRFGEIRSSRPLPGGRGSVFTANTRRAKPSRDREGAVGGLDPRKFTNPLT